MIDKTLDWFIPHICSSCGEIGSLLCLNCEDNIIEDGFLNCIVCLAPCYNHNLCQRCRPKVAYAQAYVVGWRQEALKALIDNYKFEHAQAGASRLVDILDRRLPVLPGDTTISFVPTIRAHVRQRGFDHMRLIVKGLAARRGLRWAQLLSRSTQTVQHGASREQRLRQSKTAFKLTNGSVEGSILLIDDIFTTGATVNQAAKLLRRATKSQVALAIIARQPLDD